MTDNDAIVREAIDKHNELADSFFVTGHDALERGDHFSAPFTYGRWRIRRQLETVLPREGRGLRLLDVGCGIGEELSICQRHGYDVAGLEPAAEMRRLACERHPDVGGAIREGSIYEMPFESEEFDYVLSIEVVRYLERFDQAASEVARVLRPGGKWIFTVTPPANWTLGPVLSRLRCAGAPLPKIQKLRMFTHSARFLAAALPRAGLSLAALAPISFVDFASLVLHDLSAGAAEPWMRFWHPLWDRLETSRWLAWAAGYYFVVAQRDEAAR